MLALVWQDTSIHSAAPSPRRFSEAISSRTASPIQLAWATEWYLGDEQLQAANDVLVDYLHQLQLAAQSTRWAATTSIDSRHRQATCDLSGASMTPATEPS